MEAYIAKIISPEVFVRFELDEKRSYKEGIPKAHYKFIFASNFRNKDKEGKVVSNPQREILLDVLFADHQYPVIVTRPIQTEWLSHIGDALYVSTPDINSITGDKLTAFAPNTTGVPYGMGKEREIMKHLFDIGCLFELLDNIEVFKQSFDATAKEEMKYRPERNIANVEEILRDIIATALLIARKDILKEEEERTKFNELDRGIKQFKHFVYSSNFRITDAQIASAKAAYLAAIILTKHTGELRRFATTIPQTEYLIKHPEYNTLNKRLKFVGSGEALFYWYHTIGLLYPEV